MKTKVRKKRGSWRFDARECPKCGRPIAERDWATHSCGTAPPAPTMKCPQCQVAVSALDFAAHLHSHQGSPGPALPRMRRCPICQASIDWVELSRHLHRQHADSRGHVHGYRRQFVGGVGKIPFGALSYTRKQIAADAAAGAELRRLHALGRAAAARSQKARRKKNLAKSTRGASA